MIFAEGGRANPNFMLVICDRFTQPLRPRGTMQACIVDDQTRLVFRHSLVDVPNHELLKILVCGEAHKCVQMLPIAGQKAADRIAVLFGDSSLVAMSETLEGAIYAVPVSQLVSLFLRFFDLGFGTYSLGCGFSKPTERHDQDKKENRLPNVARCNSHH
jgi:hypothetical protein